MQFNAPPIKWTLPFANSATIKTEVPVTSPDDARASLSLGFPPRTGQPPEAGGVPPQQSDMNGLLNQMSRVIWWTALGGNRFTYDAAFAGDSNVSGYARGAILMSADGLGTWISIADGNTANPDTVGTGWVPGSAHGVLALAGQSGGTVNLTPAQAAKRSIVISGTLTSNLVLTVPNWTYDWSVTNNTTGSFTVTFKTVAGTGAVIPQNGAPTPVRGDGTNIVQVSNNIAPGTSPTQALRVGQKGYQRATVSGSWVVPDGVTTVYVSAIAPGGGGGSAGAGATSSGGSVGGGGGGGGAGQALIRVGYAVTPGSTVSWTIGTAGSGAATNALNAGVNGNNGGNLVISGTGFNGGTNVTLTGGGGGGGGGAGTPTAAGAAGGVGDPRGGSGHDAVSISSTLGAGGAGGAGASSGFGGGGAGGRGATGSGTPGLVAAGFGSGGGGGGGPYKIGEGAGGAGGNGAPGLLILEW